MPCWPRRRRSAPASAPAPRRQTRSASRPALFTVRADTTAAGAHPDVTIDFAVARRDPVADEQFRPDEFGEVRSFGLAGSIKELELALPAGLVADPTVASICPMGDIIQNECRREAAIGHIAPLLFMTNAGPGNGSISSFGSSRLFRTNPLAGEVAAFGASVANFPFRFGVTVGPDGGYRIVSTLKLLNEFAPVASSRLVLWGIPADHQGPSLDPNDFSGFGGPLRDDEGNLAPRRAFTANATTCDGQPQGASLTLTSWQEKVKLAPVVAELPAVSGCDAVPFDPALSVRASTTTAGAPAGYSVELTVPQPWTRAVGEGETPVPASAQLRDATIALPPGVALSPGVASGLDACSDEQFALGSSAEEQCPEASRIGTVRLETPLIEQPLEGIVYLASQRSQDPASGEMYRIFLTAKTPGTTIKLLGRIKADPLSGQLTTSFLDNPQLPFTRLTVAFKDGDRAPLVNPTSCGTTTATATLRAWSGATRAASSDVAIDGGCAARGFAPAFTAGTLSPRAGAFSPFTLTVTRGDADQELAGLTLDLPSGLLGALSTVPVCAEAQAAAGSCGPVSLLGSTRVAVGSGGQPFSLPGTVSLAGPYKGAPFSLSIAVPAKAGPLDLGLVVVRAPLNIDAAHAKVSAPVDPLPQIVGGVPLHYRSIAVTLDRPGFMFNATSCEPAAVAATLTSAGGTAVRASTPYQPQGCAGLRFAPKLRLGFTGKTQTGKRSHPGLTASLGTLVGGAGLARVRVELPLSVALDLDNSKQIWCKPAAAAARACPASSIVGRATARTPALPQPLSGPIYFVDGRYAPEGSTNRRLPKLWLKLEGSGVPLDLWAESEVTKDLRLATTFIGVPDAPISGFELRIDAGARGILISSGGICGDARVAQTAFDAQNGGRRSGRVTIAAPACRPRIVSLKAGAGRRQVAVALDGLLPGRVSLSGAGIRATSRTVGAAHSATIPVALSTAARRALAAGTPVTVRVRVALAPRGGRRVSGATRSLTIRPLARTAAGRG